RARDRAEERRRSAGTAETARHRREPDRDRGEASPRREEEVSASATSHATPSAPAPRRLPTWLEALLLCALIAVGTGARIDCTLRCPWFDRVSSDGILTTDPALIAYVTDRIVEAGGAPPSDFRADPRPEFPETSDLPAMETVGQEFVVAWTKLL